MPVYLNAALMLVATVAGFLALAKLAQRLRSGQFVPRLPGRAAMAEASSMRVERSCMIDGRRRLVAVRCEDQRIVLLTGGANDLVVLVSPLAGGEPA